MINFSELSTKQAKTLRSKQRRHENKIHMNTNKRAFGIQMILRPPRPPCCPPQFESALYLAKNIKGKGLRGGGGLKYFRVENKIDWIVNLPFHCQSLRGKVIFKFSTFWKLI